MVTDHKPLVTLFHKLHAIPIQALASFLYISDGLWCSQLLSILYDTDALLLMPTRMLWVGYCCPSARVKFLPLLYMRQFCCWRIYNPCTPVNASMIEAETATRSSLCRIVSNSCEDEDLKLFWNHRLELLAHQGGILWGIRVVVPPTLQASILHQLHDVHPEIVWMKSLGLQFAMVWWLGFDTELEGVVHRIWCELSQSQHASLPKAPLYILGCGLHDHGPITTSIMQVHS